MLFELVLMLVVFCLGFTLVASFRARDILRKAIGNAIVHEAELDQEITKLIQWKKLAILEGVELTRDRDKWQVECAKLRATVERQAGDIVRLETSLKTAQRGNAVRASNR